MISFLDLFKWDRFVATSVIELLFWLLAAIAVLFGISSLISGLALVQIAPGHGLLAIAGSIIGTLAAIVAARVVCEAVVMLFRVNENLMDIRDSLANAAERQPHAIEVPALDPYAAAIEAMLPEPPRPAAATTPPPSRAENRWGETRPPEPRAQEPRQEPKAEPRTSEARAAEARSSETASLEARLAEIRARREAAATRVSTAPSQSQDAGLAGARAHLEEAAAPKWEGLPAAEARREAVKPAAVEVKAPVAAAKAPVLGTNPGVESLMPEVKAPEVNVPVASATDVRAPEVKAPEPKRGEVRKPDARKAEKAEKAAEPAVVMAADEAPLDTDPTSKDAVAEVEKVLDEAVRALAGEADAAVEATVVKPAKQKTDDAA
jgi:hypothetical protein